MQERSVKSLLSHRVVLMLCAYFRVDLLIREEMVFTKQPGKVERNHFGPHLKPDLRGALGGVAFAGRERRGWIASRPDLT